MAQTAVNFNMAQAFEGLLADSEFKKTDGTRTAVAAIPFGRGVTKVVGEDEQVQLPDGTDNTIFGISHSTQAIEQTSAGVVEYADKEPVNVLRRGVVWVQAEEAIDPDSDSVFCRYASGGGGTVIGRFRTDADTASAVAVTGAIFLTSTAAAGLVKIEINFP